MNRRGLFILVSFLLIPVLLISLLEVSFYFLGVQTTYEEEDPFLGFKSIQPLFEELPSKDDAGERLFVTRASKLKWFNYQKFKADKPENGYRIFCFGGSTTYGRPYFFKTAFSNWLQVILRALDPSTEFEVINVGGVSYASYRVVNLMKEMVNYQPDLFVVYSGHNEFLEERTYSEVLSESKWVTQLRAHLNRLRTYSLARNIWLGLRDRDRNQAQEKYQMTGEVNAILDQSFGLNSYQRDPGNTQAILNHFHLNLERMVAIAEQHGIGIVFVVPPSNEKDFSPFKSELSESLQPAESQQWRERYEEGRYLLQHENYDNALLSFGQASAIDSGYADLRYRMGQCLFALHRYQEAKREFVSARDLDVAPLRATTSIQNWVREVGQQRHVPTIDLVKILEEKDAESLGHSILGREFFLDHAHPTIKVHQMLAEKLAQLLVDQEQIVPRKSWQQVHFTALYDSVMQTIDSTYYAVRDLNLAKVLSWAGKTEEATPFVVRAAAALPDHPEAQYLRGLVFQDNGDLAKAEMSYKKVVELDSTFYKAYNALGSIYDRTDRLDEAIANFREAIHFKPDYAHAYYNLGNLLYRKNQTEEAIAAYKEAIRLDPQHSKALNNLGAIYMMSKKYDAAVQTFEKTLQVEPENFKAYSNLGVIYFQQGDFHQSHAMFEKVLEIRPGDNFAMAWLKRLDQQVK